MKVSIIEFIVKRLSHFTKNIIVCTILREGIENDPIPTEIFLRSCLKSID